MLFKGRKVVILRFNKLMTKHSIAYLISGTVLVLHDIAYLAGTPYLYARIKLSTKNYPSTNE